MDIGMNGTHPAYASLMQSPAFLIRRLHQIHSALFAEEAAGLDITPVQFSVLSAVGRLSGRDQSAIAEEIGVDRATLASVVARLEIAGLLRRTISREDQRQKLLSLTAKGKTLLGRMQRPFTRAVERALAPLDMSEQKTFLTLLTLLVEGGNSHARAKLRSAVE